MQCNIDARGKRARFILGAMTVLSAIVVGVCVACGVLASPWWWLAVVVMLAAGGFGIYEARSGWCAVRAMGWKTPI